LSTAGVEIEEIELDEELAGQMAVDPGASALVIRRVKLHRGTPVAWVVDYVPEGFLDFEILRKEFAGSVLDVLLAHVELQVEYSDATVTALPADGQLAGHLDVRPGTSLISLEEVTLTRSGEAINVSHCWMIPEHFSFTLRRRRGNS
jgi:DNA-binding GntR family transcriptional regulator